MKEVRSCIPMVLYACHDHAMSGWHLAYKHTFGKMRDRFWWPTLHHDAKNWCDDCQACQRRKSRHRLAKLHTCHLPVDCISTCFNGPHRIQNVISILNRTEVLIRAKYLRLFHTIYRARRTSGQERQDRCKSSSCRKGIWYLRITRDYIQIKARITKITCNAVERRFWLQEN